MPRRSGKVSSPRPAATTSTAATLHEPAGPSRINEAVGEALAEYADLLAITGGEPFKVRVYEKAARSVAGYPADVSSLDVEGLKSIPGVGASIAVKISEFLDHGSFNELDERRALVPAGVRSMLSVPGLGPRRAVHLYEELGLSSIPQLLDALQHHRLRDLRGFGTKTEENLLRAMHFHREAGGRVPLSVALQLAEQVLDDLQHLPQVERATYAGSLRRMCETIGDIDLLVASEDPGPVMETFCSLDIVSDVLAHGTTRSSVLTRKGIQIDVRVVPVEVWGAALQYFTGSKAHNIRLRKLALQRGLKLSEYGVFRVEDDDRVASDTEEAVYDAVGLPWMLPTLREDRGEVEAAQRGELPHVVELDDMRGDLHTHTNLTDGLATLEQMADAAAERGLVYYAVTDHAPLLYMERMTKERALEQREQLRALSRHCPAQLFHGSELNIQPDGSLDWDDEFLEGFDVIVASVHSHFTQSRAEMTRRVIRAIEHPLVNIIGHPTGRLIGKRPGIDLDYDAVFEAAARSDTALEINAFPDRLDLDDELLLRARQHGTLFAVDTDSHAVPHLANLRFGVATAQRGWVTPDRVVNTYPIDRLRAFLAKQQRPSSRT